MVTALANEGFLVRSGEESVLVDALFRATGPYPEFFQQGPSEALLERLLNGDGEFAGIDVALATHHHQDHHDARTTVEFLKRHDKAILVATEATAATLVEHPGYDEVAERVTVPTLAWSECADLEPNGIEVRVCRVRHSGSPELTNHVYRVNLGGFRFAHEGDAELSAAAFRDMGLAEDELDLAFLHYWWVTAEEGRSIVSRWLAPRAVVLMHHRWAAAEAARERLTGLSPEVLQALPPVTVFGAEAEQATFPRE